MHFKSDIKVNILFLLKKNIHNDLIFIYYLIFMDNNNYWVGSQGFIQK